MAGEGEILDETRDDGVLSASAAPDVATPWEQRILQLDGRRYSLRLEHEFWSALETIAERRKLRLNRLVAEIASHRSELGNLSSALRVFCLSEIERGAAGRAPTPDRTGISSLIETAPYPAIMLDTDRIVVAMNDDFTRWSGVKSSVLLRQRFETYFHFQGAGHKAADSSWTIPLEPEQTCIIGVMPGVVIAAAARLVPVLSARGRRRCIVWVMGS